MSSTWFKSVSALKIAIPYFNGHYYCDNYVLIAETAESNLTNHRGGHDYHRWIYAEGEYNEVMREVFKSAISFDDGSSKWKPNKKDSIGFIRACKKALAEAKEATELPYDINGYIYWGENEAFNYIFKLFDGIEGVTKKPFYNTNVLVAKDIATYITTKRRINSIIKDYKERVIAEGNAQAFDEWVRNNSKYYDYLTIA